MKPVTPAAERRVEMPLLTRDAANTVDTATRASIDPDARTVEVIFSAGAEVKRRDWWDGGTFVEKLDLSPSAVRLDRLNSGNAPVLDSHDSWSLDAHLGSVVAGSASVDGKQGVAKLQFPAAGVDEKADRIFAKIEAGQLSRVSIGYAVHLWEELREEGRLLERTARDWEPYEISFVSIPADPHAGVRSEDRLITCTIRALPTSEEDPMKPEVKPAGGSDPVNDEAIKTRVDSAVREALEKHNKESGEIRQLVRNAGLDDKFADDLVGRGISPEHAGNHVLEEMVKRHGKGAPAFSRARQVGDSGEDPAVISQRMSDALAAKMSPRITMTDEARAFAPMSMLEMGVHLMEARGERLPTMRTAQERYDQLQRVMSTSDFPQILANSSNRVLLAEHAAAAPTFKKVFAKKTFKDFRPHSFIRSGDFPILLEKGETADYKNGAIGESKNQLVLGEYGRIVSISRRVLINDDLGAFAALPRQAAKRSAQFENQMAWALLALNSGAGPTVYDPEINSGNGRPLFHANHGNLAGSGAAISVDTVGAGRAAMMVQKGVGKDAGILNIQPSYALTGALALTAAEQFFVLITAPTTDGTTNPFKGKIEPIGDGNLSGNAWYLFADPDEAETLVYGYLEGAEGPRFETRSRFENEGIDFKIAEDFAVGAVDFRGAYKNPGA